MEIFLIRVLQFMLAISILVLLHEGGHFFFAKLFGIRVEKFYLFFDPWFHIFEFKPKNSDTTYGMGWLPLGGYCKISGMIDESFDTEQMKQPPQPWEFRTKPAWQRLLVMIGGVLVNFLLALFIYSMILFHWGDTYIPAKNMTYGLKFNSEAKALGFRDGDILVGTEDGEFKDFNVDLFREVSGATQVNIIRGGKPMTINTPGDLNLLHMIKNEPMFMSPLTPAVVDSVLPKTPAATIGMQKGDRIVGFNGKPIDSYNTFMYEIARLSDVMAVAKTPADSMKARKAVIVLEREATVADVANSTSEVAADSTNAAGAAKVAKISTQLVRDTAQVTLTADLKVGFVIRSVMATYKPVTLEYGFFESFPAGIKYGIHVLASYVDDMKYVFSAEGAKSLGGFGSIGSLFPPTWDWYMFWKMTAFLSIILAFMNILPIPALDGGHVLFLLYEMITRRKPSEKFMIGAEYVGFAILVLLMIVANLNDILRWMGYL